MAKLNRDFLKAASTGIELAAPVLLFAFIGYKFDEWQKSQPWGMVAGLFLGFVVGIWNVIKFVIGTSHENS